MNVRTTYSKPSGDIGKEEAKRSRDESKLVAQQKKALRFLARQKPRKICTLCGKKLKGKRFTHRGIDFVLCNTCEHITSYNQPPEDYPFTKATGYSYTSIYPKLSRKDYDDRKGRVYRPKLDWAVASLKAEGYTSSQIKKMQWVEIGCGAGYFLSALSDLGVKERTGVDIDANLIAYANDTLGKNTALVSKDSAGETIQKYRADIYVAFFVFEHIERLFDLAAILRTLPKRTILIFSVPMLGFSMLLENMLRDSYARNLDGAMHTQIFTDSSVDYFLKEAGFKKSAEWIFGQDAMDLARFIKNNSHRYPEEVYEILATRVAASVDGIQTVLDHTRLSDQRHILAIKT